MSDLLKEADELIAKYKCSCSNKDYHGCTDCMNVGYIFDNEEIILVTKMYTEIKRLQEIEWMYNGLCK